MLRLITQCLAEMIRVTTTQAVKQTWKEENIIMCTFVYRKYTINSVYCKLSFPFNLLGESEMMCFLAECGPTANMQLA